MAITTYLRSSPRFGVKSPRLHNGQPTDWVWFNEEGLEPAPGDDVMTAEAPSKEA